MERMDMAYSIKSRNVQQQWNQHKCFLDTDCMKGMSAFTDKTSPLGTLWYAARIIHGRKSYGQKRFEKSLTGIKSNVLFGHLTDAQEEMSLRIMSRLLFGFTKIVNIQSSSIYQNSVQLLGSIHREMGVEQKGVDLAPTTTQVSLTSITLPENTYFMEYPCDFVQTWNAPNETQYNLLDAATEQAQDITLLDAAAQPEEPIQAAEGDDQQSLKDNSLWDLNSLGLDDEPAAGPSRQPQTSTSHTHSSLDLHDQMVSTGDDNNMDDYMDWSRLFTDVGQDLLQNPITGNPRSHSSSDGYQRVPVISPSARQQVRQDSTTAMSADAIDVNSPLWDISGLSISPPPATLPPAFPPPTLAAWMNEYNIPAMDNNDNALAAVPQPINSPVASIQTDDYHQLVPRMASPTPPPIAPPPRRRRRRRGLMDLESTVLPTAALIDIHAIIMDRPAVQADPLPAHGVPSRGTALKQLVNRYRARMQQPKMTIGQPVPFWLREARLGRYGNTVIEQARRLEQGRNRDPHSQDDFALSNANDDSDTHRFSSADPSHFGQDNFDFPEMALVDDRPNRQSNTSTSSAGNQQPQTRRSSDASFGNLLTSSTASDRGRQWTGTTDEPDYNELLEMGVYMQAPDLDGQDFYDYLRLSRRDHNNICIFDRVFPKGVGGSKRSEVAQAFYHVLACSTLNYIRPEQVEPYGPLHLHLLDKDGT